MILKLPSILNKKAKQKIILCFSILVTGRCNKHCSYCHFYASRKRSELNTDIDDTLFHVYCKFITKVKKILPAHIELQCRFSGGEPLILKDRIFQLANKLYKTTKIEPYILSNGGLITKDIIDKARKNYIKLLYISIENPLEREKGTCDPIIIMEKIKKFDSKKLPIMPGVVIIKNKHFKNLFKICSIFYNKFQKLPTINELSYSFFSPPTKKELKALYTNVYQVVRTFFHKTPIKLFPYISPELCYGGNNHYILELDVNNKYKMTTKNYHKKIKEVFKQLDINYPLLNCQEKTCDWIEFCQNVKWVWQHNFNKIKSSEKLKSYCEMKKNINQAYFDALINGKNQYNLYK